MNPSLAFHSPEAIRNEQERLLRKQIEYVAAHSPFYKKLLATIKSIHKPFNRLKI